MDSSLPVIHIEESAVKAFLLAAVIANQRVCVFISAVPYKQAEFALLKGDINALLYGQRIYIGFISPEGIRTLDGYGTFEHSIKQHIRYKRKGTGLHTLIFARGSEIGGNVFSPLPKEDLLLSELSWMEK